MSINILIIDDDKKAVERLINSLRRADTNNIIGECVVDDSVIYEDNIEKYNPMKFGVRFDVLLVDYQLNSQFTGALVAAWIMLQLKIPKLTLTSGIYAGPREGFEGFILKDELLDNPQMIIKKLVSVIDNFNSKKWFEEQHQALVSEYQVQLENKTLLQTNFADDKNLLLLEKILDKFEKVLDEEQEKEIKARMNICSQKESYNEIYESQNKKIDELDQTLEDLFTELSQYE
ncbi:hypothetical protein [Lachnoclostridium phytofermentans]|uniref:Response regulatory domain-containing protein n=1 Tax=Lachnoclostridium phytofermentans (strain ATCC 700394 / DSM 18823 / ISDg) TaxID=357809 RepID=A9KS25_LACP7|nr:hypothetical protein [Lachnoclostridium phytofermentans]ABX40656.1 hypothetical protein Cphy_0269 [Lachnoclostridium phytofermentans ISDg]